MTINWLAIIAAAFIPMIVGFIWYNPKVFGNTWMKVADMTDEKARGGNMALIFGVSFLFSIMLAMILQALTIHQIGVFSILVEEPGFNDPGSEVAVLYTTFMEKYGMNSRTFGHGAFHGFFAGLFFALPVLGTNALFERKGFKYIAVNAGYWIVTITLMGGIVCGWV